MPAASGFAGRSAGRKESRQQTRSFQPAKKPANYAGSNLKLILFFHLHRLHQVSFDYSIIVFFGIRRGILHIPQKNGSQFTFCGRYLLLTHRSITIHQIKRLFDIFRIT